MTEPHKPFQHVAWRSLPYSMGVEIGSDWQDKAPDDPVFEIYRTCGFWTKAETKLLDTISRKFWGAWLEIGAHTGWCTEVLQWHASRVTAIEPMFSRIDWFNRFQENINLPGDVAGQMKGIGNVMPWAGRSDEYFAIWDGAGGRTFDGVLIDGDHNAPCPLNDARNAFDRLNERAVVLLHDFRGEPVWDAAKYLVDRGMQFKVYPSVHMVCVCWRGQFDPDRTIDGKFDPSLIGSNEPPPTFQEGAVDWAAHYGLPEWAKQ